MHDIKFDIINKPKDWYIEPPKNGEKYHKFVLKMELQTNRGWRVLDHSAKIIFKRRGGEDNIELTCLPLSKDIYRDDKDIDFFIELSPKNYNKLEYLRAGGHLEARLSIDEMFLISIFMTNGNKATNQSATETFIDYNFNNNIPSPSIIIKYDATKLKDCELLIMQDKWVERVIKPLGMGDRFIVEIPCKLPEIPALKPRNKDLKVLNKRIEKGTELLKSAIEEYNSKRDHEKCITKVREASDLLHTLGHDKGKNADLERIKFYGRQLIENTGTGDNPISQEIVESIFKIIDGTFEISSKVPHGVTHKTKEPFNYTPDHEDAEMLLGIISLIYYWMSVKFEKSMIKE